MIERAVILAGGRGTRLQPFTFAFPKPLMPIGETPILAIVLRQLRAAGIRRVTLAVGHLAELIEAYFASNQPAGLEVNYSREQEPLGTAGPLSLVENLREPFLAMNGDVLTDLNYTELVAFHRTRRAVATIASYEKAVQIDLGVLDVDGQDRLVQYIEKPMHQFRVSMGVYVFEPVVLKYIERERRLDLPDLINALLAAGERLAVYPFAGCWLDIGRGDDYSRAVEEYSREPERFLPPESASPVSSESRKP